MHDAFFEFAYFVGREDGPREYQNVRLDAITRLVERNDGLHAEVHALIGQKHRIYLVSGSTVTAAWMRLQRAGVGMMPFNSYRVGTDDAMKAYLVTRAIEGYHTYPDDLFVLDMADGGTCLIHKDEIDKVLSAPTR